jgi:hypothetical protein
MAMDREHRRLFSSGRGPQFLVVINADNGKVVQSLPISSGADANVFEPETGLLFVSTRVGKLHIFHEDSPDKLTEVETLKTEFGAKTMNIDPFSGHRGFWSGCCTNEEESSSGAKADSWHVSRSDLWPLEKPLRRRGGLRPPLQSLEFC